MSEPEPHPVEVGDASVTDLRERLARAEWPEQPGELGWELGTDIGAARLVCSHWADGYDFARLERLNEIGSYAWEGIHFLHAGEGGGEDPVVLLHGWPSGPIEYEPAARLLLEAGREVIVPSLPGFAWSAAPAEPLNVAGVSARLRALLEQGLGLDRYVVAGGDWGGIVAARIAFDSPERVSGLYVSTPGVLPRPADLAEPPAERGRARLRGARAALAAPRGPSPADPVGGPGRALAGAERLAGRARGLPAGEVPALVGQRRRPRAPLLVRRALRLSDDVLGQRRDRAFDEALLGGATRSLAAGARRAHRRSRPRSRSSPGASEGELSEAKARSTNTLATLNPPREWSERSLSDLRRWNEMPSGGHFGAFEEPEALRRGPARLPRRARAI